LVISKMSLTNIDHRLFQSHRYAVVDGQHREEIPAHWPQLVMAPSFLDKDTGRCPVLVNVGALSTKDQGELLGKLDAQCAERASTLVSILVASDEEFMQVKNHLTQRTIVRLQQGGPASQLRYFDPGTFVQLPAILGDVGMAWLMGNVSSVAIPWAGHWDTYVKPQVPHAKSYNFGLSREHLKALLDLSAVNRAADQLAPPANQQDWVRRCQTLSAPVQRAQQHGLNLVKDQVRFALHAVQHHPLFDQHAQIEKLLVTLQNSTPEDELDYEELTSRLSAADWQTIVEELPVMP
jgi:Domain of unknown function (DUF4123)